MKNRKLVLRVPLQIKISFANESLAQYALFMFLCSEAMRQIIASIIGNITISAYITIMLIYAPFAVLVLKGGFHAKDFIFLWIIIALAFGASYILYPENAYYFTRPMYGVLYRVLRLDRAIYGYLFIRLCTDKKRILKTLETASFFLMIYYVVTLVNAIRLGYWLEYNGVGILVQRSYSLVFGYNVILPTIVFLYLAIRNGKLINYIMVAIGVLCIILGGSRGPILCIVIFMLFFMLRNWKIWSTNYLFLLLCGIFAAFCMFFVFGGSMTIINSLKTMGIESRTLEKLLAGSITDDNGRNIIWSMAIDMIKKSNFFGYGLYGDRPVISSFHYSGYCHNIFLEILVNFGVPIGCLLIVLIFIKSIKMLFFCADEEWRNLFLIFFACSCELILSMSLWYVSYFWLAFGVSVNYHKEYKGKNKNNREVSI